MLVVDPEAVSFDGEAWDEVSMVVVDRSASRELIEWEEVGPFPVFADVAEARVRVRVTQLVAAGDLDPPRPGAEGELVFVARRSPGDAVKRRVSAGCVVTDVRYELTRKGATRVVSLVAVSSVGTADPVTVTDGGA